MPDTRGTINHTQNSRIMQEITIMKVEKYF